MLSILAFITAWCALSLTAAAAWAALRTWQKHRAHRATTTRRRGR